MLIKGYQRNCTKSCVVCYVKTCQDRVEQSGQPKNAAHKVSEVFREDSAESAAAKKKIERTNERMKERVLQMENVSQKAPSNNRESVANSQMQSELS